MQQGTASLKRECEDCRIVGSIEPFVQAVERLYETMEKYLEEHDESPVREDVLDFSLKFPISFLFMTAWTKTMLFIRNWKRMTALWSSCSA